MRPSNLSFFNQPPLSDPIRGGVGSAAKFRYRVGVRRDGVDKWLTEWKDNLILDTGLDLVSSVAWCNTWQYCIFGNSVSPTPVRRDSGAILVTQSGTTLTAAGSFFLSSDVGRLWKFGTGAGGAEMYISGFTSATSVTVLVSGTVSTPTAGTIWYVNNTAVGSVFSETATYSSIGGDNFSSVSGNVITMQRTFIGSVAGGSTTLTEIGFVNNGVNSDIFDYDLITPTVSIIAGDIPIAQGQLLLTVTPNSSTSVGNVGTGCNTTGNCSLAGLGINGSLGFSSLGFAYLNSAGNNAISINNACLDATGDGDNLGGVGSSSTTLVTLTAGNVGTTVPGWIAANTTSRGSYTPGSFFLDRTYGFNTSTANGPIFMIGMADGSGNTLCWNQVFTTPFTKTNVQSFTFVLRFSWQRILSN